MSFKEHLSYEDLLIPKLATGFGGGIGRRGSLCGAFVGSIMVLGMKFGRTDPQDRETASKVYETCRQFWDRFEKKLGSVSCFDLTGCHLDTPEGMKRFLETGGKEKCREIVEETARILCDFVEG